MKKILKPFLIASISLLVSCSDNSTENIKGFKPVKLVFKEKKEKLLFFKNKKESLPTQQEKDFFYNESVNLREDGNDIPNRYILFETEKSLKVYTSYNGKNGTRSFEYKFEDGFLKLFFEGKYLPYAIGNNTKKISFLRLTSLKSEKDSSGISTSGGGSGEIESYMLLPFSFESTQGHLHYLNLEEITGNINFYLYKAEYIFTE